MIDLYYWTTPNGHKITIFLEEAGLPYEIKPIDINAGQQFKPEFLEISPNNRIPAIVDHAPADGPFRYVDELRSVLGVSEADYRALRDLVTTASGREEVDEATAPESVRRAADIAQGLVADPDDPADAAEEAEPPVFAADPAGLYTIDVRVVAADTFTRHARTLVWLQPLDAVRGYQILDHRGWLLPREAEPVKER